MNRNIKSILAIFLQCSLVWSEKKKKKKWQEKMRPRDPVKKEEILFRKNKQKKVSFALVPEKNRCDGRRKVDGFFFGFFFFSFALSVEHKNWLEKVEIDRGRREER